MRLSILRRCVAGASSAGAAASSPVAQQRASDVFAMRRAPNSLHTPEMRSNTLSEHPMTHKAQQNELGYKQRKLTERGEFEKAAAAEIEAATREQDGKSGHETKEYRNVVLCMVAGYLTAHSVVYKYYYPDDVRFSYEPDRGYTEDVERRRRVLQTVDELVGFSVLDGVYVKSRAQHKLPLVEHA